MEGKRQQAAAASAAMSERSARKWQRGSLPSESKKARRRWRSRPDPFAAVWESDVVPLLRTDPDGELSATTILEWLDERHPVRFRQVSAEDAATPDQRLQSPSWAGS